MLGKNTNINLGPECNSDCPIDWAWKEGCTNGHPDYADGTKVRWVEGLDCNGNLVQNDDIYLCNEENTISQLNLGCRDFGGATVANGTDGGADIATWEVNGNINHVESLSSPTSWIIATTLSNVLASSTIYVIKLRGFKSGIEVISAWIDPYTGTVVTTDVVNDPFPIDFILDDGTTGCTVVDAIVAGDPNNTPSDGIYMLDRITLQSTQILGNETTVTSDITEIIQVGFENIDCECIESKVACNPPVNNLCAYVEKEAAIRPFSTPPNYDGLTRATSFAGATLDGCIQGTWETTTPTFGSGPNRFPPGITNWFVSMLNSGSGVYNNTMRLNLWAKHGCITESVIRMTDIDVAFGNSQGETYNISGLSGYSGLTEYTASGTPAYYPFGTYTSVPLGTQGTLDADGNYFANDTTDGAGLQVVYNSGFTNQIISASNDQNGQSVVWMFVKYLAPLRVEIDCDTGELTYWDDNVFDETNPYDVDGNPILTSVEIDAADIINKPCCVAESKPQQDAFDPYGDCDIESTLIIRCVDGTQTVQDTDGNSVTLNDGDEIAYNTLLCDDTVVGFSIVSINNSTVQIALPAPGGPTDPDVPPFNTKACDPAPSILGPSCIADEKGVQWIRYQIVSADGSVITNLYYDQSGTPGTPSGVEANFTNCPNDSGLVDIEKACFEAFGQEYKGYAFVYSDGEIQFGPTADPSNTLPTAQPFCCDDCIQVFGCRDGRLAYDAGSTVVMSNGDVLDIEGLRYSQVADLITNIYGGTYAAPSLGGPMGPNFSQCQGSSDHEIQLYNVPVEVVSISEMTNFGKFGKCLVPDVDCDSCPSDIQSDTVCNSTDQIVDGITIPSGQPIIRKVITSYEKQGCSCIEGKTITAFYNFQDPAQEFTVVPAFEGPCNSEASTVSRCDRNGNEIQVTSITVFTDDGGLIVTSYADAGGVPIPEPLLPLSICNPDVEPIDACITREDGSIVYGTLHVQYDSAGIPGYDVSTFTSSDGVSETLGITTFKLNCTEDCIDCGKEEYQYCYDISSFAFTCPSSTISIDNTVTDLCSGSSTNAGVFITDGDICSTGGIRSATDSVRHPNAVNNTGAGFDIATVLGDPQDLAGQIVATGCVGGATQTGNSTVKAIFGADVFSLSGTAATITLSGTWNTGSGIAIGVYDCASNTVLPFAPGETQIPSTYDLSNFGVQVFNSPTGDWSFNGNASWEVDTSTVADLSTLVIYTVVMNPPNDELCDLAVNGITAAPSSCDITDALTLVEVLTQTTETVWTIDGDTICTISEAELGSLTCGADSVDPTINVIGGVQKANLVRICRADLDYIVNNNSTSENISIISREVCLDVDGTILNAYAILELTSGSTILLRYEDSIGQEVVGTIVNCDCDSVDVLPEVVAPDNASFASAGDALNQFTTICALFRGSCEANLVSGATTTGLVDGGTYSTGWVALRTCSRGAAESIDYDWGDGNIDAGTTSATAHEYTTAGTYTVTATINSGGACNGTVFATYTVTFV